MYSVLELLEHSMVPGGGLSLEKLRSFTRPPTQVEQIQRIKTISSLGYSMYIYTVHTDVSGMLMHIMHVPKSRIYSD